MGTAISHANGTPGVAVIVKPDVVTPLDSGGSADLWTFELPPQAHCTKDTATFAYHVFTYIVPSTTDPATLTFTSSGPSAGNPLYDNLGNVQTALNTAPTTGQVIGLPVDFSWSTFSPDGSAGIANPNGAYNVGVACAQNTGAGDVFWNVVVTFAASTSDPNKQTWTAANPTANATTTTTAAGGATTTSSSVAGGTTTTSSSVAGGTTTTSSSVAGDSTTTSSTAAVVTGTSPLATTGAADGTLYDWGVALVAIGLALALLAEYRRAPGQTE